MRCSAPATTVVAPAAAEISLEALVRFGRALADPTRAAVLMELRDEPGYPAELAEQVGVSRQSMSNHLACLRDCGLVVAVPEGRRTRYELADPRLAHALGDVAQVVLAVDAGHQPPHPASEPGRAS